ncbi:hypothetical protein B0T17DRAFT_518109, partial [Bombardia bombarda]
MHRKNTACISCNLVLTGLALKPSMDVPYMVALGQGMVVMKSTVAFLHSRVQETHCRGRVLSRILLNMSFAAQPQQQL